MSCLRFNEATSVGSGPLQGEEVLQTSKSPSGIEVVWEPHCSVQYLTKLSSSDLVVYILLPIPGNRVMYVFPDVVVT